MEILKWRFCLPERLLVHHLPFGHLVREIAQDYMELPRFQAKAIEALHSTAESHLVKLFEDASLLAHHAKRVTIYKFDFRLVCRIRVERE